MIIDFHTHVYPPKQQAAPAWQGKCPMTIENVLQAQDRHGVDATVISNHTPYLRHADLDKGHGRIEVRRLESTASLNDHLAAWPGLRQACRLERRRTIGDKHSVETVYAITSLSRNQADAARLLALRRGHWSIENGLHRHKDVNFGEDASLIHVGAGPTVMALLRDAALSLLHQAGIRRIASSLRRHSQQPERAVALVLSPLPTGA